MPIGRKKAAEQTLEDENSRGRSCVMRDVAPVSGTVESTQILRQCKSLEAGIGRLQEWCTVGSGHVPLRFAVHVLGTGHFCKFVKGYRRLPIWISKARKGCPVTV